LVEEVWIMSRVSYLVIYEGDDAESNIAAYVPTFEASIMGDTYEETKSLVHEIIDQEIASLMRTGQGIPPENAHSETIKLAGGTYPVLYESSSSTNRYTAYIPGLRILLAGNSLIDVKSKVRTVLKEELKQRTISGKSMPKDLVRIESVTVEIKCSSNALFRHNSFKNEEVVYYI
jgi:predicted RNase H-like HicB family nuclease